jgi:geranylgeranyl diphosphate synthase type I
MSNVEGMTHIRSVPEILSWGRDMVDPALRAAVDTLPASIRRMASYHFGWSDEHGHPATANSGKAIRPTLALLASEAFGGGAAAGLPAAVAVELVHNFSLLHDDVIDRDTTRRHRPTAWTVFGMPAAILAGDALLALAQEVLASSGHPAAFDAMHRLASAVIDVSDGQIADTGFEARSDVGLAECLHMAASKTGALMGCACALGASFGGASPEQVEQLQGFGQHLGLAFQLADDLMGIWGDPAVTGKPVHSDLRSRKKTLPVVAALTSSTPAGAALGVVYHRSQALSRRDLRRVADLVDRAGGRTWSQATADTLLGQALHHLEAAGLAGRDAAELTLLARLAAHHDR